MATHDATSLDAACQDDFAVLAVQTEAGPDLMIRMRRELLERLQRRIALALAQSPDASQSR
jgi:hypothetical protein